MLEHRHHTRLSDAAIGRAPSRSQGKTCVFEDRMTQGTRAGRALSSNYAVGTKT